MRSANLCIYYNDSLRTAADTLLSEIRILLQARLVVNKNLATWNDVSSPKRSIGCCTPELMTFDCDDQKAAGILILQVLSGPMISMVQESLSKRPRQ